jgi:hypothetical protein
LHQGDAPKWVDSFRSVSFGRMSETVWRLAALSLYDTNLKRTRADAVPRWGATPASSEKKIRGYLGLGKNRWLRPLSVALKSGKLKKKGEKRSIRYWAM